MKKIFTVGLVCSSCGKKSENLQSDDLSQWTIIPNVDCSCGGKQILKFYDKEGNEINNG